MRKRDKNPAKRLPGRPPADQSLDTREALLDAASRLFAAHGVEAVSLRQLADEAGVTPAMVHYYFEGKSGLYEALLARTLGQILERVGAAAADGAGLESLLDVLFTTVAAEPWIPILVVREVLTEGGRLREQFVQGYASHMAKLVPSMIEKEIEAGAFREDLDPTLSLLSLLGMSLVPFIARPIVERALGITYDEDFVQRFASHTHRLFLQGAQS